MTSADPFGAVVSWVDRESLGGPLEGLRIGVKDVIAVAGVPRLCGAPHLVDAAPAKADAWCVARLADAGAEVVATTTTPAFAYGVTTPGTRNPAADGRTTGGSSGGSAAAVASGVVDAALGTDTAGSVRIPAACCGVVSLKTTQGAINREGIHPLAPSLDTVGLLARDVATTRLLASALLQHAATPRHPGPLRVAVPDEVAALPLDPDVRDAWHWARQAVQSAGATVGNVSMPLLTEAHDARGRILAAEALRVLGHLLDGDRSLPPKLRETLERSRSLSTESVLAARRVGAQLRNRMVGAFRTVDVLLLPVFACVVPPEGVDEVVIDGHRERLSSALTRLTGPANLAGLPAGTVPIGHDRDGAPTAVQVVGAWHAEQTVLEALALLEAAR